MVELLNARRHEVVLYRYWSLFNERTLRLDLDFLLLHGSLGRRLRGSSEDEPRTKWRAAKRVYSCGPRRQLKGVSSMGRADHGRRSTAEGVVPGNLAGR